MCRLCLTDMSQTLLLALLHVRVGQIMPLSQAISTQDILTCHGKKSTGVNNKMNDGCIPFGFRDLVLCMLDHFEPEQRRIQSELETPVCVCVRGL